MIHALTIAAFTLVPLLWKHWRDSRRASPWARKRPTKVRW